MSFRPILAGLVASHPSVRAIAFCDDEGERVDAYIQDPTVDAFSLDVLGASLATVLSTLWTQGEGTRVRIRQRGDTVFVKLVTRNYYVVALGARSPRDALIADALDDIAEAIRANM